PPVAGWNTFFQGLTDMRRAVLVRWRDRDLWVAAERIENVRPAYADSPEAEAVTTIVRGWMESTGPTTAAALAEKLGLPAANVDAAMVKLESEGQVLRGRFTPQTRSDTSITEWCNRRLLARIHRLTLGRLRKEIEPVSAADFVR